MKFAIVLAVLAVAIIPSAFGAEDPMEDILSTVRDIEIFKIRKSAMACPILIVGPSCPEENPLYYFKCCGDLNSSCCFRLQDWVMVLVTFLVVCIVLSIIINFIRCLCCY
ncbi:unnamed protein product [Auanema sp. JU1783]|nr:unnamed protein product [Auanema sp. JU1783]